MDGMLGVPCGVQAVGMTSGVDDGHWSAAKSGLGESLTYYIIVDSSAMERSNVEIGARHSPPLRDDRKVWT